MPTDPAAERDELQAWLQLTHSVGLGESAVRRLLQAFGSAQAVLAAGRSALSEVAGPVCAAVLADPDVACQARADADLALAWRDQQADQRHLLTLADADYPAALLQIADPPNLLYAIGDLQCLRRPALAIVGSRKASPQGLQHARSFAEALVGHGLVIVSGLALGIDAAAHAGALRGLGATIAVVGTGIDRVYPKSHLELARRIAASGLILSEFRLGTPPLAANFPRRNRIIAGLSLGTLVVEAALQSGSLITARLAAEGGREVFALPGSIQAPQSRGCHWLIKQGAQLVETADEVWQGLPPAQRGGSPAAAAEAGAEPYSVDSATEDPLLQALGHDPVTLDALCARSGWPVDRLQAKLLELELEGQLVRLPGGLLQRQRSS